MLNPELSIPGSARPEVDFSPFRTALGRHIFLDRYALKATDSRQAKVGDTVVVHEGQTGKSRSWMGRVSGDWERGWFVRPEGGGDGVSVTFDNMDLCLEICPTQAWDRMARGAAELEKESAREYWQAEFRWALEGFKFVPAGRVWTGLGRDEGKEVTLSNCFVLGHFGDSREGIFERLQQFTDAQARGGGVGINVSGLRYRGAPIRKVNGRSSGSVSWAALFAYVSRDLVSQGGSRRGASLVLLEVWHPDVLEFITCKTKPGFMEGANISVGISDAFMQAVKEDREWELIFPDTDSVHYRTAWTGDIEAWKGAGLPVVVHQTMPARELWEKLTNAAWASAEPGLVFLERTRKQANSSYYTDGRIICVNPCAEEPLSGNGACNLSHIHLGMFANGRQGCAITSMDLGALARTVQAAVRFQDNLIDVGAFPFPEAKAQQQLERRIGLGTLGLAEAMVMAGVRYGSDEAVQWTRELYSFIATQAYAASMDLAEERGAFPAYGEAFWGQPFAQKMARKLHTTGPIRNVTLLTAAPTGSIGTMVGTSTGIEPFFELEWEREGRFGKQRERAWVVDQYLERNPGQGNPACFVTAMDLDPVEHVKMQAAVQEWVDASVSKTANLPAHYTPQQVKELYELMYELGCKGGTVYRDGCRNEQVLSRVVNGDSGGVELVEIVPLETATAATQGMNGKASTNGKIAKRRPVLMPCPNSAPSIRVRKETPNGTAHIHAVTVDGDPHELFVDVGKAGSDLKGMAEALGRMVSLVLRLRSEVTAREKVALIVDQLEGIGGPRTAGFGEKQVKSVPDAVAQVLQDLWLREPGEQEQSGWSEQEVAIGGVVVANVKVNADLCPRCGNQSFRREGGCVHCSGCGHSEC